MQASPSDRAQTIRITIDAGAKPLHKVPADFHGTNLVALWNPTGDSPEAGRALAQMNLKRLRFPGGVPCQWYDWEKPLATGWTKISPQRAARFARQAGASLVFQTNTATDSIGVSKETGQKYTFDSSGAHAAAWVRAAKKERLPVGLWEVGNEPEMDAPKEHKATPAAIYAWYNAKFDEQARAMKQADPAIRIAGPASANTYFWWAQGNLEKFLRAHGNRQGSGLVDVLTLHWYAEAGGKPWEQERGAAQSWELAARYIRETLAKYDSRPLPLVITEWNWGGGDKNLSNRQMAGALGNADCVGIFLRSGIVTGHTHFCLQRLDKNWGVLATRDDSRLENSPGPSYFALTMAAHLTGDVLAVQNSADEKNVLSAYAARSKTGLWTLLVNKTDKAQKVEITLPRYRGKEGGVIDVYTLRGAKSRLADEDVVYNGVAAPQPARSPLPPPRHMPPPSGSVPFARTMEPYSVMVLRFP